MEKRIIRDRLLVSTFFILGLYYISRIIVYTDSFYKFSYHIYQECYEANDYLNNFLLKVDSSLEKNRIENSKQNYESAIELMNGKKYDEAITKLNHVVREDTVRYGDAQRKINILENVQLAYKHYYSDDDKTKVVNYISAVLALDPQNTDILPLREKQAIVDIMGYPLKYPNKLANTKWNAEFEKYSYFKRTITLHEDGTLELLYTSDPVGSGEVPVTLTFKGSYKLTDEDGLNGTWTVSKIDDPSIKCEGNFTLLSGNKNELPELCVWDQNTLDSFTGYYAS